MSDVIFARIDEDRPRHKCEHPGYEYYKREVVKGEQGHQCSVCITEIPPGKSAYPYHYHARNEETFYIVKGVGTLRTPTGERTVGEGDLIFFPASEKGAHKLTNASDTEPLVYLDIDTYNCPDVAFYPDSSKMGVYDHDMKRVFREQSQVDYYDGE